MLAAIPADHGALFFPDAWFGPAAPWWALLLGGAVALYAVMKGADWLVEGAAGSALRLGMPKIIIGATIVSLGTTMPEAAVSVLAAWTGNSGLALGNGVGSIIVDTAVIFGLGALLTRLPADQFVLARQGWVQLGAAVALALWCYLRFAISGDAAELSWPVGIAFVLALGWYLWQSVRWSRQRASVHRDAISHGEPDPDYADPDELELGELTGAVGKSMTLLIILGIVGLVLVVVGGDAMVASATQLATRAGVPQIVLAATLVAFGTSLPELVVGMTSIRKGHPELLVGNVIGADILNVLFVIGFSAIGGALAGNGLPIVEEGNRVFLYLHLPTMLLVLVLFRLYIVRAGRTGGFDRWMGAPMLAIYLAYVILQFGVSG